MRSPTIHNEARDMTPDERRACVEWFATLPLAELRTRQDLCTAQIAIAHTNRLTHALENLRVMEEDLTRAVMLKCFGESS